SVTYLLCTPYFFIFNAPPPPQISTLSLHDALPICAPLPLGDEHRLHRLGVPQIPEVLLRTVLRDLMRRQRQPAQRQRLGEGPPQDRKSTRLNSSHVAISYAVFCLKKKKHKIEATT